MCRECPDVICSDEKRVRQVLTNLLNNALKFTQRGHIILLVSLKGPMLLFRVTDTGIGIKAEDIPKLFTRFTQIEYTYTRKFGGTGLGLAISKTITDLLEGEMGVESEFGKGSTFWFTIPTRPKQLPALTHTKSTPALSDEVFITFKQLTVPGNSDIAEARKIIYSSTQSPALWFDARHLQR